MKKTKSRLGPAIDSIFNPTKEQKAKETAAAEGWMDAMLAPARGTSVENKSTVILTPGQMDFLDHLALDIRTKTKAKIKRTEIIRALVAGLMASGLDLTGYKTAEDIAEVIKTRLKG